MARSSLKARRAVALAALWPVLVLGTGMTGAGEARGAEPQPELVVSGPATGRCPRGYDCVAFSVTCASPYADVPPITGRAAIGVPLAEPRGLVMFFGGGGGMDYWAYRVRERRRQVERLRVMGFETIEIAWDSPWAQGTKGLAAESCRPAAAIRWGAGLEAALGATPPPGDGVCGFCVMGYSYGSTEVVHAITFNAVAEMLDAVVALAGPSSTDIPAGCRRDGSPLQYREQSQSLARSRVDDSLDDGDPLPGPCESDPSDPSWEQTWAADSSALAGAHLFPTTRVHYIWGSRDNVGAVGHGITHMAALDAAGTTMLDYDCVDAYHDVLQNPIAYVHLERAITWVPADGFRNAPPLPVPQLAPRCQVT